MFQRPVRALARSHPAAPSPRPWPCASRRRRRRSRRRARATHRAPCSVLLHAVLHVDLLRLVARERGVETRQHAVFVHRRELLLVEEVHASRCSPKKSQLSPVCPVACRSSRNARNGAMPVPGPIMITGVDRVFRQPEVRVRMEKDRHRDAHAGARRPGGRWPHPGGRGHARRSAPRAPWSAHCP